MSAPDYQDMVARLVEAIGGYTGQGFIATADERGTRAALEALGSAVPCLAPPVDDRAAWLAMLREAVRVQDPTCTLELVSAQRPAIVFETLEHYPIPAGVSLVDGLALVIPSSDGGRDLIGRVTDVCLYGRLARVRVKIYATRERSPEHGEAASGDGRRLRGDELENF